MKKLVRYIVALVLALGMIGAATTTNASAKNLKTVPTSIRGHWFGVPYEAPIAFAFAKNGFAEYGPSAKAYTSNGYTSNLKKWEHVDGHNINKSFTISNKKTKTGYYAFKVKGLDGTMYVKPSTNKGKKAITIHGGVFPGGTIKLVNYAQFKAYGI